MEGMYKKSDDLLGVEGVCSQPAITSGVGPNDDASPHSARASDRPLRWIAPKRRPGVALWPRVSADDAS